MAHAPQPTRLLSDAAPAAIVILPAAAAATPSAVAPSLAPRPEATPGSIAFPTLAKPSVAQAPARPKPLAGARFDPFWVQNFRSTRLWSDGGPSAIAFGPLPLWSYLKVLAPSDGPRYFVLVRATSNVAYVERADLGPVNAPPSTTSLVMKQGDTLWELASRYHTTVDELVRLNALVSADQIRAGTELQAPK